MSCIDSVHCLKATACWAFRLQPACRARYGAPGQGKPLSCHSTSVVQYANSRSTMYYDQYSTLFHGSTDAISPTLIKNRLQRNTSRQHRFSSTCQGPCVDSADPAQHAHRALLCGMQHHQTMGTVCQSACSKHCVDMPPLCGLLRVICEQTRLSS